MDIDNEWDNFMDDTVIEPDKISVMRNSEAPIATDIYISTKSMIAYLNQEIDLKIFWDIPVIPYSTPTNGIIKKQIKYNSQTPEELLMIQEYIKKELYYEEQIITSINNPNGRIKFKDIRKITIGISKKDILSYRSKKKQAFYNCFVMIMRIKFKDLFKEIHVKVFNTGKLEIPGIQSEEIFEEVLIHIVNYLKPFMKEELSYTKCSDTILINSNFNCGFYINRDKLTDILKYKYNIECFYDPCQYPGIQCKIKINKADDTISTNQIKTAVEPKGEKKKKQLSSEIKTNKKNNEISFMIFRTGSILIVGKCNEIILFKIYEFLKTILKEEYKEINQQNIEIAPEKNKKKKIRKKIIEFNN
jgi:TATA-box binding protein (TBP) (component of TFIID and TFIIIB)